MMAMSPTMAWATNGNLTTTTIGGDTYYQIADSKDLAAFSNLVSARTSDNSFHMNYNAILTADITWDSSCTFNPIGVKNDDCTTSLKDYTGTFDGNGHTIRSLNITPIIRCGTTHCGFFYFLKGGTVKNLNITNLNWKSTVQCNGFLAKSISGSTLSNVYIEGTINVELFENYFGVFGSEIYGETTFTNCGVNVVLAQDTRQYSHSDACGFFFSAKYGAKVTLNNCYFGGSFTGINASNADYAAGTYRHAYPFYKEVIGTVNFNNCYAVTYQGEYLTDYTVRNTNAGITYKEPSAFASGEVAYLLNGSTNAGTWRQTLGTDNRPMLDKSHSLVYRKCYEAAYINSEAAIHNISTNGICTSGDYYQSCSGAGTSASPYLIANAGNLLWFRDIANSTKQDAYGKLTTDIDLSGVNWNNSIGEAGNGYCGVFNGNGCKIKNMKQGTGGVNSKARPLFCTIYTSGKVSGLTLDAPDVFMNDAYQGCLARLNKGTIERCLVVNGYIQAGKYGYLAGFCGYNESTGVIDNCGIVNTTVQRTGVSGWHANAFVDTNNGGKIRNCYAKGANFTNTSNSWFVAFNREGSSLSNCYFSWGSSVSGTKHTGFIIVDSQGEVQSTDPKLIDASLFTSGELCYKLNGGETNGSQAWRQTLTGTGADVFPVTINTHSTVYRNTNYYCDRATLKNYSYSNIANAHSYDAHEYNDNGFCYGTAGKEHLEPAKKTSTYYEVGNAGQLYSYAQSPDLDLYITKDITVNAQVLNADRSLVADVSSLRSWEPLQNSDNIFTKNVYGNGHTISGLYCNMPEGKDAGFIKKLRGSVEKLSIVDSYFHGAYNVGAIATSMDAKNISINNCYVNANVSATGGVSPSYVGGITSYTDYSVTLRNNLAIVTATGADNTTIGGIIAVTQQTYYDTNCLYNTSNMKCFGNINESAYSNATNFSDITDKELSSGVVAWYLNECKYDNCTWYQTLGESGDAVPHLTSRGNDTVYGALGVFTNTRNNDEKNTITVPLTYYQPTGKYYGAVWSDLPVEIINDGHSKVYGEVIRRAYPQMDYYHARLYTKDGERYLDHEGVFIVSDQPTINVAYIINTPDKTIYSKPNGNAYYKGSPRAYTCQDVDLVFGGKDGVIGFYQYTGKTVSPYKARLQNTGDKETLLLPLAKGYAIEFEDEEETTAVETLEDATYNMTNNAVVGIYDINGVQQESMKPGINIVRMADGTTRKIFIK